jgi:lactocepin
LKGLENFFPKKFSNVLNFSRGERLMTKIKWKFILVAAVICCFVPTNAAFAAKGNFDDVQSHWAKTYIDALVEKGAVSGMDDGLFHPDSTITINQFVTMIIASQYGRQKPVAGGDWASGYIKLASEKGVIDGIDTLCADDPMSRSTAARISHYTLLNILGESDEDDVSAASRLLDFDTCKICREHIEQCYTKGIVAGRPDGLFDGNAYLTRAEACVIVLKVIDVSLRTPPSN